MQIKSELVANTLSSSSSSPHESITSSTKSIVSSSAKKVSSSLSAKFWRKLDRKVVCNQAWFLENKFFKTEFYTPISKLCCNILLWNPQYFLVTQYSFFQQLITAIYYLRRITVATPAYETKKFLHFDTFFHVISSTRTKFFNGIHFLNFFFTFLFT